ncbi:MAG TPA: hypothetical protein VKK79_26285 [Candidatus Lokiarchaeia archaeon]|nr:hypothetical protein [Candidatus Lokiarchaeia archaeon]
MVNDRKKVALILLLTSCGVLISSGFAFWILMPQEVFETPSRTFSFSSVTPPVLAWSVDMPPGIITAEDWYLMNFHLSIEVDIDNASYSANQNASLTLHVYPRGLNEFMVSVWDDSSIRTGTAHLGSWNWDFGNIQKVDIFLGWSYNCSGKIILTFIHTPGTPIYSLVYFGVGVGFTVFAIFQWRKSPRGTGVEEKPMSAGESKPVLYRKVLLGALLELALLGSMLFWAGTSLPLLVLVGSLTPSLLYLFSSGPKVEEDERIFEEEERKMAESKEESKVARA